MDIIVNGEQVPETASNAAMVSPELGAALADLREAQHAARVRGEVITEILAEFGQHYCEDPDCESYVRIPTARLTGWRERAALEGE